MARISDILRKTGAISQGQSANSMPAKSPKRRDFTIEMEVHAICADLFRGKVFQGDQDRFNPEALDRLDAQQRDWVHRKVGTGIFARWFLEFSRKFQEGELQNPEWTDGGEFHPSWNFKHKDRRRWASQVTTCHRVRQVHLESAGMDPSDSGSPYIHARQ
jgi:hypothetical protein